MVPVVRGPPQHALLRARHREQRQHELEDATGLERAVGEIAVVARGDREHPDRIAAEQPAQRRPAPPHPECSDEGHQVDTPEREVVAPGWTYCFHMTTLAPPPSS